MEYLSLISGIVTTLFILFPMTALLFYYIIRSSIEDRRKNAVIMECNKQATEFYRLAIADMKEMQDYEGPHW